MMAVLRKVVRLEGYSGCRDRDPSQVVFKFEFSTLKVIIVWPRWEVLIGRGFPFSKNSIDEKPRQQKRSLTF